MITFSFPKVTVFILGGMLISYLNRPDIPDLAVDRYTNIVMLESLFVFVIILSTAKAL